MFTGIIEEVGLVKNILNKNQCKTFCIKAKTIFEDLKVEDSVSINGICLTVEKINAFVFETTAVQETLNRTTLETVRIGSKVNLERALLLKDRLGGHLVSGHVDGIGKIVSQRRQGEANLLDIEIPDSTIKYCIEKGSITIDGISLTIAGIHKNRITISVIPYTWNNTTLALKKVGDSVNVEGDLIGKYVEKFMYQNNPQKKLTEEWLRSKGF